MSQPMANNRMSVLPVPPQPSPTYVKPLPSQKCLRGCQPDPVCARPLILDGKGRTQRKKQMDRQPAWPQPHPLGVSQRRTPMPKTPEAAPPLMMSASSSGSFHNSLYLLAVSMTLAAVYLWGATGCSGQGRGVGPGRDNCSPFPRPAPTPTPATHRLMELRRREPDFRFRVVQTMRSVNRKRDRSFLPPTAFCGARGRIQAQRPTLLPTVPWGQPGPGRGEGSPPAAQRQRQSWDSTRGACWGGRAGRAVGSGSEQMCEPSGVGAGTSTQTTGRFLPLR